MLASFLAGLLLLSPAASMGNTVRAEPVEEPDDEVICRRRQVAGAHVFDQCPRHVGPGESGQIGGIEFREVFHGRQA